MEQIAHSPKMMDYVCHVLVSTDSAFLPWCHRCHRLLDRAFHRGPKLSKTLPSIVVCHCLEQPAPADGRGGGGGGGGGVVHAANWTTNQKDGPNRIGLSRTTSPG